VAEPLPHKHRVWSSNPSTAKKKSYFLFKEALVMHICNPASRRLRQKDGEFYATWIT
jgi:hypothetical protein